MSIVCYKCGKANHPSEVWYGLHPSCFKKWFGLSSLERFQNIASHQATSDPLSQGKRSSFFHGKFKKYSSVLGNSKYILKVEDPEYPELPVTEYLCNQLFSSLGVSVPPFYLLRFEEEHACFVTKNFMEDFPSANLVHLYHFLGKEVPYSCENVVRVIREKTGRIQAQEDFVYLTLADSLIGNNDRHGRNLGLVQTAKEYVLSPFYDNPSYLATELHSLLGADHQPMGAIHTKHSTEPSMRDYMREWKRLGFDHVIERFRQAVSLERIRALIVASHISPKRQDALLRLITKRSQELCI